MDFIYSIYYPCMKHYLIDYSLKNVNPDFPGGAVVESPPANAGDTGSSPGPGRSHMRGGAAEPVRHNY